MGKAFLMYFAVVIACSYHANGDEALNSKLEAAMKVVDDTLQTLHKRWDIDNYPRFLKAVTMTHTSWEVMKLKFQSKVLNAAAGRPQKFVMSFMGSSVTAGHDSPFNKSFPMLTGEYMAPALEAAGIKLESRNAAMGNNPCLPYDVCVKPFAGLDADLVHWEQGYNCFGTSADKRHVFEQFIRQALALPNQPVVVFAESSTPNWKEEDCDKAKAKPDISAKENHALNLLPGKEDNSYKIASELNNDKENFNFWSQQLKTFQAYRTAGIQMWRHSAYEAYKCHGPYIRKWKCCSASWHPSLLGHELRAAHHSYFWLLIFRDALKEVIKEADHTSKLLSTVQKHIESEHKYVPDKPMFPCHFPDNLHCMTTFQPLADPSSDLLSIVVPSTDSNTSAAFKHNIIEEMAHPGSTKKYRDIGYKDYKWMLYGNKDSMPLSLHIHVKAVGYAWMCQPPGNWGKLPNGFSNFWEVNTEVYMTKNVADVKNFVFSKEKAVLMKYVNHKPKDTQNVCVEFEEQFPQGQHVLTVVPTTGSKIMISSLIYP